MGVLLVTVVRPAGSLDLVVPAEATVGTLLGPLARLHGAAEEARSVPLDRWSLALPHGHALPHDRSLGACGIGDGAVLVLSGEPPPEAAAPAAPRTRRCPVVGVLSAVPGLGRTTVTALLAGALTDVCGDLTVAVDAHPGVGSLTERLAPDHGVTAADLLALVDHPAFTRQELIACLAGQGQGLALVASRLSRGRAPPLDQRDWVGLVRGLARHASAVVLDCGPGLGDPGARAALATADQIVLVAEPYHSPATRRTARTLLDKGLPVVLVAARAPPGFDPAELADRLPGVRGVVPLPPDPAAERIPPQAGTVTSSGRAPGRRPRPTGASNPWPDRARRLAQLLVADWTALGIARGAGH
jgi:MinD-like ATPase involved in chromosome partitioning or flagellar assembly